MDSPLRIDGVDVFIEGGGAETILQHIVEQACPDAPVTLLLHDWGCVFGYQFALRQPQLVRRVIGVDIGDAGSPAHRAARRLHENLMVFAYQAWLALAWRIDSAFGKPFQFQSNEWLQALRATPGNQVLEFDTGHWLMQSKPREFNAAVEAWLAASA